MRRYVFSILFLIAVLAALSFVLAYAESRSGFVIEKGWMDFFPPRDLSPGIFFSTYGLALLGIVLCFRRSETGLRLIQGYAFLSLLRCITLLCVPLDPPEGIVPLNDWLLKSTFYAGRDNLKDLFFSGHVATLILFGLILKEKSWKRIFFAGALAVGIMVVLQRVHYVSDVLAAPVFAGIAWYMSGKFAAKTIRDGEW